MHSAIRVATPADREALQRLINEAFIIERRIKKGGGDRLDAEGRELDGLLTRGTFLVSEHDGELAACVYLEPRGDHYYLGLLSVARHRQGSGLGRQMALASEAFVREHGCRRIGLRVVSPRQEELVPLYLKLGYTTQGTEDYPPELAAEMDLPGHFILMSKEL